MILTKDLEVTDLLYLDNVNLGIAQIPAFSRERRTSISPNEIYFSCTVEYEEGRDAKSALHCAWDVYPQVRHRSL